jgi:hypothetical protein
VDAPPVLPLLPPVELPELPPVALEPAVPDVPPVSGPGDSSSPPQATAAVDAKIAARNA